MRRNTRRKAIAVLEDDGNAPVGVALPVGGDADGVAIWRIFIGLTELPGRWIVVDRELHTGPYRRPARATA